MENESSDMQDRTRSREFRENPHPWKLNGSVRQKLIRGFDKSTGLEFSVWVYGCVQCRMIITETNEPMDPEGLEAKMRRHKCASPGKTDFENELR